MEIKFVTLSREVMWACPRCHTDLATGASASAGNSFPLKVATREVHSSASLESYTEACPSCGLPYTATGGKRFEYPYRQMLAKVDFRRFLRWSAAQNNGYVAYSLMRGSSCSVDGRPDAERFSDFIQENLTASPGVVLDIGCGPLPTPAYLPAFPDATLIGVDPFDSEWSGPFVQGAGEFLPLKDASIDMVVAATALDHALDVTTALRELARVTRKGGSLMVWDHTFPNRTLAGSWHRLLVFFGTLLLPRFSASAKIVQLRSLFPERARIYDNGIVLWTPKGYADPFHEPRSRRKSWTRRLRRVIEDAGFTQMAEDSAWGFSQFTRN
jgi:SAM-dependent methyltransferase